MSRSTETLHQGRDREVLGHQRVTAKMDDAAQPADQAPLRQGQDHHQRQHDRGKRHGIEERDFERHWLARLKEYQHMKDTAYRPAGKRVRAFLRARTREWRAACDDAGVRRLREGAQHSAVRGPRFDPHSTRCRSARRRPPRWRRRVPRSSRTMVPTSCCRWMTPRSAAARAQGRGAARRVQSHPAQLGCDRHHVRASAGAARHEQDGR